MQARLLLAAPLRTLIFSPNYCKTLSSTYMLIFSYIKFAHLLLVPHSAQSHSPMLLTPNIDNLQLVHTSLCILPYWGHHHHHKTPSSHTNLCSLLQRWHTFLITSLNKPPKYLEDLITPLTIFPPTNLTRLLFKLAFNFLHSHTHPSTTKHCSWPAKSVATFVSFANSTTL